MAWDLSPRPRCGYVLDWYPAYKAQQCAVEWMKVPPGVSRANISAGQLLENQCLSKLLPSSRCCNLRQLDTARFSACFSCSRQKSHIVKEFSFLWLSVEIM